MIPDFAQARKAKFERGAIEHADQKWEDLDAVSEIREELCDLWNYSTLLKDKELAWEIQSMVEGLWNKL